MDQLKTLLVHYTPRTERSKSKVLLDAFRQEIPHAAIEELDLCHDVPDLFGIDALAAYYARNITGEIPSDTPLKLLAKMDRMTAQIKSCEVLVVAFPMYNFSMPAAVKAWFDSVMLYRETFSIDPTGQALWAGLMTGKKALALVGAGGIYSRGNGVSPLYGPTWEHALSLAKTEFAFMGFSDIRGVLAEGLVVDKENMARNLNAAVEQVQNIAYEWYGSRERKQV